MLRGTSLLWRFLLLQGFTLNSFGTGAARTNAEPKGGCQGPDLVQESGAFWLGSGRSPWTPLSAEVHGARLARDPALEPRGLPQSAQMVFNFLEGELLIYFWNKAGEGNGRGRGLKSITKPPLPPNLPSPPAPKGISPAAPMSPLSCTIGWGSSQPSPPAASMGQLARREPELFSL